MLEGMLWKRSRQPYHTLCCFVQTGPIPAARPYSNKGRHGRTHCSIAGIQLRSSASSWVRTRTCDMHTRMASHGHGATGSPCCNLDTLRFT